MLRRLTDLNAYPEDRPYLIGLSIPFAIFYFLLLVAWRLPGSITELEEMLLFVLAWIFVPVFTVASLWLILRLRKSYISQSANYLLLLLLVDSVYWAVFITALQVGWRSSVSIAGQTMILAASLTLFPFANLLASLSYRRFPALSGDSSRLERMVLFALPLLALAVLANFTDSTDYWPAKNITAAKAALAIPLGLLSLFHHRIFPAQSPPRSWETRLLNGIAVVLFTLMCLNLQFSFNQSHANFYLGPVNTILHGRTILVDTFSQYGVGVLLFLAAFFKTRVLPLNYQGFSFLISILYLLQFLLLYWIAKILLRSTRLALATVILIILVNSFVQPVPIVVYPSTGPLRFGPSYLLLGLIVLRHQTVRYRRLAYILELTLLGLISLWSFETFIYTAGMYSGVIAYEVFAVDDPAGWPRRLIQRIAPVIPAILISHLIFAAGVLWVSGALPRWSYYLRFIFVYSVDGFGTLPFRGWSPWIVLMGTCFITLMAFFWSIASGADRQEDFRKKVVLGLAALGAAQFTYYLARSHPYHILDTSIPAILIIAYWISLCTGRVEKVWNGFERSALYSAYCLYAVILILSVRLGTYKAPYTGFATLQNMVQAMLQEGSPRRVLAEIYQGLYQPLPAAPLASSAAEIYEAYWPEQGQVASLIEPEAETEAMMLTGKINLFPISHMTQDSLSLPVRQKILDFALTLPIGQKLLVMSHPVGKKYGEELQVKVLVEMCKKFALREVWSTPQGLSIVKLAPLSAQNENYCSRLAEAITP